MTPQEVEKEKAAGRKIDRSVHPTTLLPANIQAARICSDLWRINPDAPLSNLANIVDLCQLYGFVDSELITRKALHVIPEIARLQFEKTKREREEKANAGKPEDYAAMRMRGVTFGTS